MQFYPHNISTTLVGNAVSASLSLSGSFINNFAAITVNRVNTASLALNITGSRGADGDNILLLSSAWSGSACAAPPVNCYAFDFGNTYSFGGVRSCDFGNIVTYYSTDSTLSAGSSPMYYNNICTNLASNANPLGAYGPTSTAYSTNASGILQAIEACNESF
jgi:hypothetical protein